MSISILGTVASSFLSKIFHQRSVCLKPGLRFSIDVGQNSSSIVIDVAHSTKVNRQVPAREGKTERPPGAIELCSPGADDPSLELQHHPCWLLVDCDSQHVLLSGNRETKVRSDTKDGVIHKKIKGLYLSLGC